MNRRDFLKAFAASLALAAVPKPILALAKSAPAAIDWTTFNVIELRAVKGIVSRVTINGLTHISEADAAKACLFFAVESDRVVFGPNRELAMLIPEGVPDIVHIGATVRCYDTPNMLDADDLYVADGSGHS